MNNYLCIKLDMAGSRSLSYKEWLQTLSEHLMAQSISFVIAPTRRAGDELFMVVDSMQKAWHCLRIIYRQVRLSSYQVYVGIGRGEVHGAEEGSEGIDGSAIWRASDALLELKSVPGTVLLEEIRRSAFRYNLKVSEQDVVNRYHLQNLYMVFSRMLERTALQQEAADLKFFYPEQSNTWYADKLFQGEQGEHGEVNFSKHLSRGHYKELQEMEQTIIHYFESEMNP